ncbi:uncharacterized protein M6B38_381325 [Iris pallida]|uniref:Uncharacterized protein n=1 Tax=Iris pallida TaxID=29817 RepID=A0AAX6G7Y1_IRIPA|nr:uncharacterized protein M6B38_381325 [Iris pallida]
MAESFDVVLDFLKRNGLSKSEAALRRELAVRRDSDGEEERNGRRKKQSGGEMLKELIVKEIEIRSNKKDADLYPWNFNPTYDLAEAAAMADVPYSKDDVLDSLWGRGDEPWREEEEEEKKSVGSVVAMAAAAENHGEGLPRLRPVKLKLEEKSESYVGLEERVADAHVSGGESKFLLGSFLDVPLGQEINSSGEKRTVGSSWQSVSRGISEGSSNLVSGFDNFGDAEADNSNEYWDSDEYEDDEDVGYKRQPIEDETWFLAQEIDYPSDTEKGTVPGCDPDQYACDPSKDGDDGQFAEEDSYFSGEQYYQEKNIQSSEALMDHAVPKIYGRQEQNSLMPNYDGQLMDIEELNLMSAEPVWQGFVTQSSGLGLLDNGGVPNEFGQHQPDDCCIDFGQHGSVRSIGVGINNDVADVGSGTCECFNGESTGGKGYCNDHGFGIIGARYLQHDNNNSHFASSKKDKSSNANNASAGCITSLEKGVSQPGVSSSGGGFSFPRRLKTLDMQVMDAGNSVWANRIPIVGTDTDGFGNGIGTDDMLVTWKRKSNTSSPVNSSRCENIIGTAPSKKSTASSASNDAYSRGEGIVNNNQNYDTRDARDEDPGIMPEDEETIAVQEQVKQIKFQEEEFETFNLKIVHRKNRHNWL